MRRLALVFTMILGLGVALMLGEVIARATSPPSSRSYMVGDPILHHRLRIHDRRSVLGHEFQTNSLGLRDREYAMPKPANVFRVVALGDSFTEGGGLPIEATIPKQMEAQLNACSGARVIEVVNAGVASYSPILEYLLLKTVALKLEPDLVVMMFDMTDVKDDFIRTATARLDADGLPLAAPGDHRVESGLLMPPIKKPALLRFLNPLEIRVGRLKIYRDFRMTWLGERLLGSLKLTPERLAELDLIGNIQYDYGALARPLEHPSERVGWTLTKRYITGTRDLARQHGIPFVVVVNPHAHQVSASESPVGRQAEGIGPGLYATDRPFTVLGEFGRLENIPVINPVGLLRQRTVTDGPLFKYDDPHHTPNGARVVAEAVSRSLIEHDLVPCTCGSSSARPSGRSGARAGSRRSARVR